MSKENLRTIIVIIVVSMIAILSFGLVIGQMVEKEYIYETLMIIISFVGVFATFGGAYLGARISGKYAIKVANKEREQFEQERRYIRNVYIKKYIRFNSIKFSKVHVIYTTLSNIVDNEEKIYYVYTLKDVTLTFPEDNETVKVIELYDFIYEFNKTITNIVNDEKCIVAYDKYTDALLRMQNTSKRFLNTFKRKEIVGYEFDKFKYFLEELKDTCKSIKIEHDNFWDR
ncbi:hypothetical protein BUZ94_11685 [Mammaliicoccus sciuri]|uniref:hypothetical protein n=1 Tax=Mammaliicoccus sciuri TaxID=1296 RepID=UPI000E68BFF4|nr:hypothetical protein [Mammaliicoccus sciuri]RIO08114.1 hypothetical protein BUZ94_11685 [Mammaliicoccus sciuri]